MRTVNKVYLHGIVGKDAELRRAGQTDIATFSLATSRKNKQEEEVTSWHRCVAFSHTAKDIMLHAKKGTKLMIDGEIRYEEYIPKDSDTKREITKIIVHSFAVIPKSQRDEVPASNSYANGHSDDELPF